MHPQQLKQNLGQKPLFRFRSSFRLIVVLAHHPFRLITLVLVSAFFLPELEKGVEAAFGVTGQKAWIVSGGIVFGILFFLPLASSWMNYKKVIYDAFPDHLSFRENGFLPDRLNIPYKSIVSVRVKKNMLQRFFGVGNVFLVSENKIGRLDRKEHFHVIPDVGHPEKMAARLEEVIRKSQTP